MLRPFLLVLAVAALVTGCGGRSVGPRLGAGELTTLVLAQKDVGPRFSEFDRGRQVRADSHGGPRGDTTRFGRQDGWKSRFRRVGVPATASGPLVVESRADVFGDARGAADDLDAYHDEWAQTATAAGASEISYPPVGGLGEDARAFSLLQGSKTAGQRLVGVARRSNGRITASVTATGSPTLAVSDVLALARKQDARVRAAGA